MRLSPGLSRPSCTATARHGPRCRPAPLGRCTNAKLSPASDAFKPWRQGRDPGSSREFGANFLPVLRSTGDGGANSPSEENNYGEGRGERDRGEDRPQPPAEVEAEAEKADARTSPEEPADGSPPEPKPSLLQQLWDFLARLLRPQDAEGTHNALGLPSQQVVKRRPRLMDSVRIRKPGTLWTVVDGVVLGSADGGERLKVWIPTGRWRPDQDCANRTPIRTPAECVLQQGYNRLPSYLKYDPERKGVPVTRFTAAPGMLVRRGYDVREGEERAAEAGEIGVLQPWPGMGDTCLVEWASGSQGTYDTGINGRFELVHLETSLTSGAPVVGQYWTGTKAHNPLELLWGGSELQTPAYVCAYGTSSGGTAYGSTAVRVERGTHWVYDGSDPNVGMIADAAGGLPEGMVTVEWPNGMAAHHHASPATGYDLCYSAQRKKPVTLFTARQGLLVNIADNNRDAAVGELLRPVAVSEYGVVWSVKFFYRSSSGLPPVETYLVDPSTSTPTNSAATGLQVETELRFR